MACSCPLSVRAHLHKMTQSEINVDYRRFSFSVFDTLLNCYNIRSLRTSGNWKEIYSLGTYARKVTEHKEKCRREITNLHCQFYERSNMTAQRTASIHYKREFHWIFYAFALMRTWSNWRVSEEVVACRQWCCIDTYEYVEHVVFYSWYEDSWVEKKEPWLQYLMYIFRYEFCCVKSLCCRSKPWRVCHVFSVEKLMISLRNGKSVQNRTVSTCIAVRLYLGSQSEDSRNRWAIGHGRVCDVAASRVLHSMR